MTAWNATAIGSAILNTPGLDINSDASRQHLANAAAIADATQQLQRQRTAYDELARVSAAPTATLHAATKSYVDTGDAARLPLTGGTLTGALTVQGNVATTGSVSATGNISTAGSFTTSFSGAATQGQVVFGNAGRRLYFNGGDMWDFNGKVHATGLVLSAGQAVYYEDSQAVWSIWESGHVRFSHQIKTPTISVDWLQNTSGGSPQLKTANGRGIVFQFVDDYANYVRFFRNDGFTNYLMQSPNMRYMDARDWGGTWAMLVQQNDGANQIFFPAAYSDERLKTNIQPTQVDALAALAAVEVVQYDWNEDGLTIGHILSQLKHVEIGVIGQQAVEHVPEMFEAGPVPLPNGDTEYRMTFHPEKAVPYLIRAIQQQQELVAALTARLVTLEAAISAAGRDA